MEKFIDGLIVSEQSGNLDHIAVYGYASPEGPFLVNDNLSNQRCEVIADYISRHAGIPRKNIRTIPERIAWDGLRRLVIRNNATPAREEVLRILDKYIPAACTDAALSDQCLKGLQSIDNGNAYKWMLENLFPELRFSLAIYAYALSDIDSVYLDSDSKVFTGRDVPPPMIGVNEDISLSICSYLEAGVAQSFPPLHRLAIKTNLLYDAALLPNLEVEWRAGYNWSLSLEGGVAWWGKYSDNKSYRLVMFSPEIKRWIRPRAPWRGFYVGLFAGGGFYDFANGGNGYSGEGGMAGLSVGYMWPISRCLSLEAAVGAGYLFTRYKEYKPLDGHHVYQRTKDLNYFGPLKVKFSFVWRLWDLNRTLRKNSKNRVYRKI